MKETYIVCIDRPGMGEMPGIGPIAEPAAAAELVRCLLACHDSNIRQVRVEISRMVTQERAV